MRPSNKSRSRNKNSNRNRNVGNVVNRVFDSAGPEGKVRGTPQQIIEKYQGLTRDAQLSGDRVAAENFQQHAEHYLRLLNEAMREQAERQSAEAQRRQNQNTHQQNDGQQQGPEPQRDAPAPPDPAQQEQPRAAAPVEVIEDSAETNSTLVETPESAPTKPRRTRSRTRRSAPTMDGETETPAAPTESNAPA